MRTAEETYRAVIVFVGILEAILCLSSAAPLMYAWQHHDRPYAVIGLLAAASAVFNGWAMVYSIRNPRAIIDAIRRGRP